MNKKFYKYIIVFLCTCVFMLSGIIYFFINEIGIVRITTEFGSDYAFFYKKKDMHRIFYIEPVGERDLNQLSDEAFNDLLEFCAAAREGTRRYKISCGSYVEDEVKRRNMLKIKDSTSGRK